MAFRGKVQFFYKCPPQASFSETWYTSDPDYTSLMTSAKAYLALRKEMLGYGVSCVEIRISDDTVKGDSLIFVPQNKDGKSSIYTLQADRADKAGMAVDTRCEGGAQRRRILSLRGAPDDLFDTDFPTGIDIGFHGFFGAFQAWATFLKGSKFAIRHVTAVGPPPTVELVTITDAIMTQAGYRKPARPFGLARGRRIA